MSGALSGSRLQESFAQSLRRQEMNVDESLTAQEVKQRMQAAEKAMHDAVQQQQCGSTYPSYGTVVGNRQTLRGRLQHQVSHAEQQAEQALKQKRLIELLDKHPEVAEILDLFEQVGR